jgi:HSP20 family molecular chaperone IbpA
MFYRHSPFHYYPVSHSLIPFLLASPESDTHPNSRQANSDEQSIKENAVTALDKSIIYQDRGVRIISNDDDIVYQLDLPGIKASDAKVEIRNGVLSVQAERKDGNNYSKYAQHFLVKESDVDSEKINANMSDGVLTISIPKKEESKPLPIAVSAEYPPEKAENDSKDVRFTVDLPGVKASDATLELKDDTISLHATRKVFDKVSTLERYFSIDRSKVDSAAFNAYLVDGVLTITGTKKESPEPKPILVTAKPNVVAIEGKKDDTEMVVVETVTEEKK